MTPEELARLRASSKFGQVTIAGRRLAALLDEVDRLTEALEAAERSKVALVEKVKRLEDLIARTRLDGTDRQKAMIGYADRAERAEADLADAQKQIDVLRQLHSHAEYAAEESMEDAALWRAQFHRKHPEYLNADGTTTPLTSDTASAEPVDWAAVATRMLGTVTEAKVERDRALADLADEKRRHAELRAGVEALASQHYNEGVGEWSGRPAVCGGCGRDWPCKQSNELRSLLSDTTECGCECNCAHASHHWASCPLSDTTTRETT